MHNRTNYHKEMPAGAIKTRQEVLDLVIEARKEKKAIRIWTVTQSGYLSCFYIMSKTKLYKKGAQHPNPNYSITTSSDVLYPTIKDHRIIGIRKTDARWFKSDEHPASYGIDSEYMTEHRMFTNKKHAENYSTCLKNDPIYLDDVKRWHEYCNKIFSSYDD